MTDEKLLSITQAAARLKLRYHKARDLVLQGRLGAIQYDGAKMLVAAEAVEAYDRQRQARKEKK